MTDLQRPGLLLWPGSAAALRQHELLLTALGDLPQASVSMDADVMTFIERERLYGSGSVMCRRRAWRVMDRPAAALL
jgi:hypothetical protein